MAEAWYVEICPYPLVDGEVKRIGPFCTERQAERCQRGVNINLNHVYFYTMVSSISPADVGEVTK